MSGDDTQNAYSACTSSALVPLCLSLHIAAGKINLFLCLQERQRQLESMGISLESSGIKVGDDKCYLVNLNADPRAQRASGLLFKGKDVKWIFTQNRRTLGLNFWL